MEVPAVIKNEIVACQQELRNAIATHQDLCFKIKREPKNVSLQGKLRQAEQYIKSVSQKQKPFIVLLRKELNLYQEKRKKERRIIDYDADNAYIAKQIEDHQLVKAEPSIFHKSKTSKYRRIKKKKQAEKNGAINGEEKFIKKEEISSRGNSTDEPEVPKSQILLNRRSNLLSALDKVYKQNTVSPVPVTSSSFLSVIPVISNPEPARLPTPSPPTSEPPPASLPSSSSQLSTDAPSTATAIHLRSYSKIRRPITPDLPPVLVQPENKQFFLRYLGLVSPEEYAAEEATLAERRKRMRSMEQEFIYDNSDKPKRKKKKQYLQQVAPPTTRAQANRASTESNKSLEQNQTDLLGIKIPQELSIEKVKPKECVVCRLGDKSECLSSCESCENYFHVSCHDRSPRGLKEDLCPTCIRRSASPDMFTEKTIIKRHLKEENEILNDNIKSLEKEKLQLQENINEDDEKRKQLLIEQTNIENNIKKIMDFINFVKKSGDNITIDETS